MKYQISTFILAVIAVIMTVSCCQRYTDDDMYISRMSTDIESCEAVLDGFNEKFPFSDTVVGTDPYSDLVEAKSNFDNANTLEAKQAYYEMYKKFFKDVYDMSMNIIEERAKEDTLRKLPMHTCPK